MRRTFLTTRGGQSAFLALSFLVLAACGSSGGGGGGNGGGGAGGGGAGGGAGGGGAGGGGGTTPAAVEEVVVDLGTAIENVVIQPNTTTQFSFTYTIPPALLTEPLTAYKSYGVDLADSMEDVQVTSTMVVDNEEPAFFDPYRLILALARSDLIGKIIGVEAAWATTPGSATVFISYPGDVNVCNTGTAIGTYNFDGDFDTVPTTSETVVDATSVGPAMHVVNTGAFEMCVEVSPLAIPMPAYLTVDEIELELETCDLDPPADEDVIGDWEGTYSCTNIGAPDNIEEDILLTISKNPDGSYRYVDDGGATYDGHFCGSVFRFTGGVPGDYTESGMFTITEPGSANKESVWNSDPAGFGGGTCLDDLQKR